MQLLTHSRNQKKAAQSLCILFSEICKQLVVNISSICILYIFSKITVIHIKYYLTLYYYHLKATWPLVTKLIYILFTKIHLQSICYSYMSVCILNSHTYKYIWVIQYKYMYFGFY